VLVIDSISHEWVGSGSLLEKKETLDSRPGSNHFANWAPISKEHEQFKSALLNANIHMVCTMRSKQGYVLSANERGKQTPEKVGMEPIQREGMEYEFTTVFDIDMTHQVTVSKDRTSLFDGKRFKITEDTGKEILAWLSQARPELPSESGIPAPTPPANGSLVTPPTSPPLSGSVHPEKSGVHCSKCGAECLLVPSKEGYSCPNFTSRGDGHERFLASFLGQKRNKQSKPTSKGA
jgi:hypothetical protein